MILPRSKDAIHKAWLLRLLIHLIDDPLLASNLFFKGGSCAAMLGWLDRFSIDLDFDLAAGADKEKLRKNLYKIYKKMGLQVKDESKRVLQFFLRYPMKPGQRNTIKLDIIDLSTASNQYSRQYLADIDRYAICQSQATMFSHKLVALMDRYERFGSIAGRDIYDIHYFFVNGFSYDSKVLSERTGLKASVYLEKLLTFIEKKVNMRNIDEDLNVLLPPEKFKAIRQSLKTEVLILLKDETNRLRGV